jgi:hypothetical protein
MSSQHCYRFYIPGMGRYEVGHWYMLGGGSMVEESKHTMKESSPQKRILWQQCK